MLYPILLAILVAAGLGCYHFFEPLQALLRQSLFRQREHVTRELEAMFIFVSVEGLQKIKWASAFGLATLGLVLAWEGRPPAAEVTAVLLGVAGYWAPEAVILYLRRRRRAAFSEQLVDGLILMANGRRAGFTLQQAVDMVIEEMPPPISQEFDLVRREWRLGVDTDQALRNCVTRTRDGDLALVVTAIQITRQLGGNLAEVFDRIVAMVRERKILAGKAEALTAEGRMQGIVVGALPYGFMLAMMKVNPDLMRLMWTTIPGLIALALVVLLDTLGFLWMRKLGRIEY